MALSVAGKTAVVTGAGSGINLAFSKLLLSKSCNVLFADLSLRPEAQEVVSAHSLSSSTFGRAVYQHTDVTDWTQLERMFAIAVAEFGIVDIVCPGAGVYEPPFSNFWYPPGSPPSIDTPTSNQYTSLSINVTHPIRVTQLAISHFLSSSPPVSASNPKSIVHISSIAAQVSALTSPIYCASKQAISGFVRSLALLEPRLGIRVTGVAPGVIKTPLWTDNSDKMKLLKEEIDEWVSAEEVADVMLACIEREENVGGTILEVGKVVRRVEALMDPGPSGKGNTVSNRTKVEAEIFGLLNTEGWGKIKKE
ncbi:MAG: hypothetical protein M1835_005956 [Candelina submexicana]|nr:MAG: hypothetical protein M1835_005956 [Candelina submexicana]